MTDAVLRVAASECQWLRVRQCQRYSEKPPAGAYGGDVARVGGAVMLANLGLIALYQGNYERATKLYQESLALSQEIGNIEHISIILDGLAGVPRG